jgi:hypothetical protein
MKKKHKIAELIQKIPILKSNQHYRAGDIINRHGLERSENSRVHILHHKEFGGSILNIYLNKISTTAFKNIPLSATKSCPQFKKFTGKFIDHSRERDYNLLGGIVKKHSDQYPLPASTELCINLRAGDILAPDPAERTALRGKGELHLLPENQENHTLIDLIKGKLAEDHSINSITFITAMHFGDHPWSLNFKYSDEKLKKNLELYGQLFCAIIEEFPFLKIKAHDLTNLQGYHQIDCHICYLCNARHLIADAGGFSQQIQFIRNELI